MGGAPFFFFVLCLVSFCVCVRRRVQVFVSVWCVRAQRVGWWVARGGLGDFCCRDRQERTALERAIP